MGPKILMRIGVLSAVAGVALLATGETREVGFALLILCLVTLGGSAAAGAVAAGGDCPAVLPEDGVTVGRIPGAPRRA